MNVELGKMAEEENEKDIGKDKEGRVQAEEQNLQPWEQHSSVVIIPRFDYNAPCSLLHHSHSGFLITCPIKREKSATKEAISILEKYIGCNSFLEEHTDKSAKKRKLCTSTGESTDIGKDERSKGMDLSCEEFQDLSEQKQTLSLVKMTRSGLLLFIFPKDCSFDPVHVVTNVHQSLESGALKQLLWCHRMLPFQASCVLDEKGVRDTVSSLVLRFVNNKTYTLSKPLKFAVGYNRRGIDQAELKTTKNSSTEPSHSSSVLDRDKCFSIVAFAVKEVVSDSLVDLKSPEMSILVECLPLSGVPNGSVVAGISVLPQALVSTKPKLGIKALVSDTKTKK